MEQRSQKPADSSKKVQEGPQEAVTETPHEQTDPELRHRPVTSPATSERTLSPPATSERTLSPPAMRERTQGRVSLVLIWVLLLAVAALVARRVFLM